MYTQFVFASGIHFLFQTNLSMTMEIPMRNYSNMAISMTKTLGNQDTVGFCDNLLDLTILNLRSQWMNVAGKSN